jgi:preprotein translocase subunit YajC
MTASAPIASLALMSGAAPGNPLIGTFVMYAAIFAIFYFILIRPQQRQRKQHEELIRQLKKGDEVVTVGGVVGEVMHIAPAGKEGAGNTPEDRITIKSADSRMIVERGRIARISRSGSPGAVSGPVSDAKV